MNRLRLSDVRTPLAKALNECASSQTVVDIVNEAHRRLVAKGRFLGTIARYQVCLNSSSCLVWPRQIESIEAYWLCQTPGTVRNNWYEASPSGPGLQTGDSCMASTLIDRGTACTFDEITGITSKIAIQSDTDESASALIIIRGYDENANWIRSQVAGTWIDGEQVAISSAYTYTTNKFTKITEVIKTVTNGNVRLWQYDTDTAQIVRQLAYYEPDETLPIYRCSLIPGLSGSTGCCNCSSSDDDDCNSTQITIIAKLRHIDVRVDNDFFLLGNLAAIKLMATAILKENRNLPEESAFYEAKALKELQDELNSYEGDGQVPIVRQESRLTWGGGVLSPIGLGYRIY